MALQIPTVTIDDLRAFHANHFPHAPAPEYILHGIEPEAAVVDDYCEEDDGLGYYPDGTKRTLTDEQIAMFRHSEIHAILRKRQLRREDGELSEEDPVPASPPLNAASSASLGSIQPMEGTSSNMKNGAGKGQSDEAEKPTTQQWATTSAKTKARLKRKRNRYATRRKEVRLEKGLPRRRSDRYGKDDDDYDDESDEWDPWHQANGPDVQKDDTLDLDY
ncbi:hypothetical protein EJ02DRAFT_420636 [Clathrospora elynae]|uniref:Uncharacterized protein n=1 Tax=Clathrospora elynae TaxID=706981 RepID=A0A6A5T019_9PLEO|nr:hypothetical protein EJ02DRAFT_420636 [Clathrospora elynae]